MKNPLSNLPANPRPGTSGADWQRQIDEQTAKQATALTVIANQGTPEKAPVKFRARHTAGKMNGTEAKYAELLELRKLAGEVVAWEFESVNLRLADKCFWRPDFMVHFPDGSILFVDTKGSGPAEESSLIKIKCAAERYPMFKFCIEKLNKGEWIRRDF